MRPELLRIQNFGPFKEKERIDFSTLGDIFLITGKTGAGKTTIFDALCFALYGAVPGGRQGHLSHLRSDYAAEGEDCQVSLDFAIGTARYRIDRSPRQEKRKKRGSGFITVEETVSLYEYQGMEPVKLNLKKSETDERIRRLLGLNRDEFFKIVLLPQGEFAEFLKQNTTERQQVLGKLFPVDRAAQIKDLAREKAREGEAELREAERALEEISARINFSNRETLLAEAAQRLEQAKAQLSVLTSRFAQLRSLQELRTREEEAALRLQSLEDTLAALEAQQAEMAASEARLGQSRKARPLEYLRVREAEVEKRLEADAAECRSAQEELSLAEAALAYEESRAGELQEQSERLRVLRDLRPRIQDLVKEEERQRQRIRDQLGIAEELASVHQERDALIAKQRRLEEEGILLHEKAKSFDELNYRWEQAKELHDIFLRVNRAAESRELLETEQRELERSQEALATEAEELLGRILVLEDGLRQLQAEKEAQDRQNMAALLGETLEEGKPCPVCGSREHPFPAVAPVHAFSIQERIQSQENAIRDARRDAASREADMRNSEREKERLERELGSLQRLTADLAAQLAPFQEAAAYTVSAMSAKEVGALLITLLDALNAVTQVRSDAQRAGTGLREIQEELLKIQIALSDREQRGSALDATSAALRAQSKEMQEKESALKLEYSAISPLPQDGQGMLADIHGRIQGIETVLSQSQEDRERGGRDASAAKAREAECRRKLETTARTYRECLEAFTASLHASPFPDAQAVIQALLPLEEEASMEAALLAWREDFSRAASLREEAQRNHAAIAQELSLEHSREQGLERGLEQGLLGDAPSLDQELARISQEQEAAEEARDHAGAVYASLLRDESHLEATAARYKALKERYSLLSAVAEDLSGKNPKKKPFDAWLLGRYLAQTAIYANRRLEKMSESRYSLLLDEESDTGRGRAGLDLAVFDAYTGKCRPCATLSGGESFMASISLALGLADSLQSRSGGIRMDAVFIDEGFGSLDEVSLDRALIILDELREQRMVGLISHVSELRARIPRHIEVVKSASGSKIITPTE